jgi:hypothetical protein
MWTRVQSLYQTVQQQRTSLDPAGRGKARRPDLDYLGLSAVNLSLKQRKDSASEDAVAGISHGIQAQLQNPSDCQTTNSASCAAPWHEYTEVLHRARRLAVRRSALEATLISLPDKMEEVYQLVITSPYSTDMGSKLEESLARLRIAEEVSAEFDTPELSDFRPTR